MGREGHGGDRGAIYATHHSDPIISVNRTTIVEFLSLPVDTDYGVRMRTRAHCQPLMWHP